MKILNRVAKDFHYQKRPHAPTITEDPDDLNNTSPLKSSNNSDDLAFDFRLNSCDINSFFGEIDYPDEYDETIPTYDDSSRLQPIKGMRVIIHNPNVYPVNSGYSFYQMLYSFSYVSFYPEMFSIVDELKSWSFEDRNCYLDNEKNLTFFKIYNRDNCVHECLTLKILEECGCVPFYMISKDLKPDS